MNKDKLISLIIRKQTYKDTKPYLNELGIGKEAAAKVSAEAVRDILTTDYIAEAKLYAVRYLKDGFEKGNPYFITLVETSILPILMNIAADEADDKAVTKYAGSSYTKTEELAKFKSILSSLFRIAKECIRKWAQWIPDSNKKFIGALAELKNKKVSLDFDYKYFREENQQYFKEYCQKNGVKLTGNAPNTRKSVNPALNKKKDPLQDAVQSALLKVEKAKNLQELSKLQNDFNEALNNYLQNSADFKEDLVQKWFDEIQNKKREATQRFQGKKKGQKISTAPSAATGATPTGAKSHQKINNEESKSASDKDKKIRKQQNISGDKNIEKSKFTESNPSKKVQNSSGSEKKEKQGKSEKQVGFSNQPNIVIDSPKQSNKEKGSPKIVIDIKQQHRQDQLLQQKKSPKASKPISKGPLIFDDIQQQFFKPPQSIKSQSHKTSEPFQRSKPQMTENRPIKPTGQESRSPKATEISRSSKQIEQSKSSKLSSEVKSRPKTKEEARPPTFNISTQGVNVGNILNDISASKEESRIEFSQEEQSEYSEESPHQQGQNTGNFKKQKPKLASIEEENYSNMSQNKSGLTMPPVRSRISEEKASVANKLLQENKQLYEKIDKLSKDFEVQKEARVSLAKQRQQLEKQLSIRRENEQRIVKKLKASVPLQDYNILKRQLQKERENQSKLYEQNAKLKASHQTLIQHLNETKQRLQNISLQDRSKIGGGASYVQGESDRSIKQRSQIVSKNLLGSRIIKEEVDQDYVRNSTHPSNMHNWLSQVNIALFKKNVLNLSEIFYRDQYLTILSKSSVYTQNDKQFLSLTFTFQFKSMKQITPAIRYKNCQQLDLWTKPLTGDQLLYTQELVVGLHRNPIKILKAQLKIIQGLVIKFLLPFMYVNFLREEAFSSEQFQEIFAMKAEQLLKSKILVLNTNTIKEPDDFKRIFKSAQISGDNKIRFCLSEGINDCIFMSQIEMLRNNKAILRILPIPATEDMNMKARQLLDDLVFLIS